VAEANAISNVEFVHIHSTDFKLPEKVDVIVHEQIGDYLFDENMVANVCDLRDRLLKPGGRVLPSRFKWYCEPVMLRDSRRVPFAWEMSAHGYDYACLREDRPDQPEYLRVASCDDNVVYRFLGPPEPSLEVDLMTIPGDAGLPRKLSIQREITQSGRLDALVVFFEVEADSDLKLTSSPLDDGRAPHWGYRILRTDTEELLAGDRVSIELEVGRWADPDTWEWAVKVGQPDQLMETDTPEEPRLPA
jgi:protein arginine N-methyltransferase 1